MLINTPRACGWSLEECATASWSRVFTVSPDARVFFPFFSFFLFFFHFHLCWMDGWLAVLLGNHTAEGFLLWKKHFIKKKKKNWHLLSQDDSYQKQKKKGKRSRVCFQDKVCFQNRKNPSWINNDTSIQPTESVKVKRFSCQKESCDPSHRFWCIPSYCGRTNCSLSRLFHPASPAPTVLWVHFYPALFKERNLQINAALSGTFSEWNACWESR